MKGFRTLLDREFINDYRTRPVPMDALGAFTYLRTYSRDGESWVDTCQRVIEGMYNLHTNVGPKWDEEKARRSARQAFDMLFNLKWSPPGRGLWMAGTDFIHGRNEVEALQNCAFISSKYIKEEGGDFFRWVMEMSMMGVGVGFDTDGAGKLVVKGPTEATTPYVIEDTRQSWAASVAALVDSFFSAGPRYQFDYSKVRPSGTPIKGFGGVASGSGALAKLHENVTATLTPLIGRDLTSTAIVDICNQIGECVIAGNVRRSAEIALGSPEDSAFRQLKSADNSVNRPWGWVSNNSVVFDRDIGWYGDITPALVENTYYNGEPGYVFRNNFQMGRINGRVANPDNAIGVNPCAEQVLAHREMCTLAEIYLPRIESKLELAHAIKFAYLYAKSVTSVSGLIRDSKSREVMQENRRIGLSLTGMAQFVGKWGVDTLIDWMEYAYSISGYYDELYSSWLAVPQSIRRTSVKPSGTVSLLAGVTPGVHYPLDRTYIRRVRVSDNSPLIERLQSANYNIVPDKYSANTLVVDFPVNLGQVKSLREVSLWDQLRLASLASLHYADNSVSLTAQFDRSQVDVEQLRQAVEWSSERFKAVSFLPYEDHGYEQAPYESISEESYNAMVAKLGPLNLSGVVSHEMADMFCDGESCEVPLVE